ncbi:helix-turn-helix domain-containing protein [Flavobacterium sp. CBA20B-1]|uniref:helix-turn-helix domain-containing protein n=1 Tax=unclassified Flavobacterium TaxID=196869 RepID=UPI0022259A68|nr:MULTISPECIES: helix-turn-helix domain-containing protein [unclassified Flavobacterium]WCM42440.1 helix-turn-helix domain-containing protein [Flavobacterium sp. CBA20B-1]
MLVINHHENLPENQKHFDQNKRHFSAQCSIVLQALQRGERLTTITALMKYKIGDLRRRIKDLKDYHNVDIQSSFVPGTRFKEYFLNN